MNTSPNVRPPTLESAVIIRRLTEDISACSALSLTAIDLRASVWVRTRGWTLAPVNTTGFTAPAVELPPVRTTASPAHRARTELGRRLWELREQMAGAGVPMLDLDELTRETRERRGE